jgi:hypothetical protein
LVLSLGVALELVEIDAVDVGIFSSIWSHNIIFNVVNDKLVVYNLNRIVVYAILKLVGDWEIFNAVCWNSIFTMRYCIGFKYVLDTIGITCPILGDIKLFFIWPIGEKNLLFVSNMVNEMLFSYAIVDRLLA